MAGMLKKLEGFHRLKTNFGLNMMPPSKIWMQKKATPLVKLSEYFEKFEAQGKVANLSYVGDAQLPMKNGNPPSRGFALMDTIVISSGWLVSNVQHYKKVATKSWHGFS